MPQRVVPLRHQSQVGGFQGGQRQHVRELVHLLARMPDPIACAARARSGARAARPTLCSLTPRKPLRERSAQRERHGAEPAPQSLCKDVAVVAAEQLVAAIARQRTR